MTLSEYYLKSSSGQDLGIYDFNSDELTWYVFGKERIAKFKHQYDNVLNKVGAGDVGFIASDGLNDELMSTLLTTRYYDQLTNEWEFNLPATLLLINMTNSNIQTYVLQSQLEIITEPYTIVNSYEITEETNQFAFTMTDGTIEYFSLEELFNILGAVANNLTLGTSIDPFELPLSLPTVVEEADFHYYTYDHLGNTRIVYSTTITNCSTPEYTLEAVMDYFPYGKILRQFIKTPEKYVTTGHERDVETGLDYRGARFYDSDVARFLSLDPLAADFPEWSAYNYVLGNPVMLVDPDGRSASSPIFGKDGEFLGTDEHGYTGDIIVMEKATYNKISQGKCKISHSVAMAKGETLDVATLSSSEAWSKLLTHVAKNMETTLKLYGEEYTDDDITDMSKLYNGKVSINSTTTDMTDYNDAYNAAHDPNTVITKDGQIKVTMTVQYGKIKGQSLTTVEDIQSTITVHEYIGHGENRVKGDANHYKVYERQMNHPLYKHTTENFQKWIEGNYDDYIKYKR